MRRLLSTVVVLLAGLGQTVALAQTPQPAVSVSRGPDGHLRYTSDQNGTRIVDFSHAGYEGGGQPLPDVPVRIVVSPDGQHDRERIQAALDLVSALPLDERGFRGAVLLEPGRFMVDRDIRLVASGVTLRGSGSADDGTTIVATGLSRRTLIVISGTGTRHEIPASRVDVADAYVPAGARAFTVTDASGLSVGTRITITRPSTAEWITTLGMNAFSGWRPENRLRWQPGSRDVVWDRVIVAIDGTRVTVDAPITTALDRRYGGGQIARYDFPGRLSRVGVERLRLISNYDAARPYDEDHAWNAITFDKVENAWVRDIAARHFAGSVVSIEADAKGVTVEDVDAAAPVSEIGGYQHYGLWYDRRRVDHNYYGSPEQRTGDVWAPFIERPWARSGIGKAWDGLSKFDLTRFNPWYFDRVKSFADIADRKGLILYLDQKDFLNGPEFQRLFDTLWASSPSMKYRAWREYRDRYPQIVTLWKGDEYPVLTAAVEQQIPAAVRAAMRPVDIVRSSRETSWALSQPGAALVVYTTSGLPVAVDLSRDKGRYSIAWVSENDAGLVAGGIVDAGGVVTLTLPAAVAGKPAVAWLTRRK